MKYFDWNATAPMLGAALEEYRRAGEAVWANPSTPYRAGVRAHNELEAARARWGEWFGVAAEQVVFCGGATEGINGVLRSYAAVSRAEDICVVSAVEHPAVQAAAEAFWGSGRVERWPVTAAGVAEPEWLAERLAAGGVGMVCLMAANNETGVRQPWEAAAELCRERGVPLLCDAVQMVGKCTEPLRLGQATAMTVSGHKFGGPRGVGAVILRETGIAVRLSHGGAQEAGRRAGTEDLPGILAMTRAMAVRMEEPPEDPVGLWRDELEAALREAWGEEVVIHGEGAPRLWNVSSLALPGQSATRWIQQLDRRGFAVSGGSACSTGREGPSPVLAAMGVDEATARRTVRISSGWGMQEKDWRELRSALLELGEAARRAGGEGGAGTVITIP